MQIYTMGFTQKSAAGFFEKILQNNIKIVIDVRLNNQSQLAGFTKGRDLAYFLQAICGCKYAHETIFAPTKELLTAYKKGSIDWDGYVAQFDQLIASRKMADYFEAKYAKYDSVLLLCSEPTPQNCHRRLLAECFSQAMGCEIRHL